MKHIDVNCETCGRVFTWWQRNTIKPKYCPSCLLKDLTSRSEKKNAHHFSWGNGNTKKVTLNREISQNKAICVTDDKKYVLIEKLHKKARIGSMATADSWFSKFIRVKHAFMVMNDGTAICKCFTCGKVYSAQNIQNGHYHSRRIMALRYHEDNCRPQCLSCNGYQQGRHTEFRANLIKQVGEERVLELDKLAVMEVHTGGMNHLKSISDKYRDKFYEVCKERGIKKW